MTRLHRLSLPAAALAAICTLTGIAHAELRYRTVDALPIYRKTVQLTAGSHSFKTLNLNPAGAYNCASPDTFLVVTKPNGTQVYNDDCTTSAGPSCLTASNASVGNWTVTVFAKEPTPIVIGQGAVAAGGVGALGAGGAVAQGAGGGGQQATQDHCGYADVKIDTTTHATQVLFGGEHVKFSAPALASGTYDFETVNLPNGADHSVLLAYNATWTQLGFDNTSGIGNSGRLQVAVPSSGTIRFIVGSYAEAASGRAAFIVNDCLDQFHLDGNPQVTCYGLGKDSDRDGLSNALEIEMGTTATDPDSDGDGLFDYFETYGRISPFLGADIELVRYGASPRRRDIFLELDREQNPAGTIRLPPTATEVMQFLEYVYEDVPSIAANLDGTKTIAVHVDTGSSCGNRPDLCGDWGGSELLRTGVDIDANVQTYVATYSLFKQHMEPIRLGLFKYGLFTVAGVGRTGTEMSIRAERMPMVAHELGHTYGLTHSGVDINADGKLLNYAPAYPSLMSYVYSYKYAGLNPKYTNLVDPSGLSCGHLSAGTVPAMDAPVEVGFMPGASTSHLTDATYGFSSAGGSASDLDLNRDGRLSTSPTLIDGAPIRNKYQGGGWPDSIGVQSIPDPIAQGAGKCDPAAGGCPVGGPSLAARAIDSPPIGKISELYGFVPYRHANGQTYPDQFTKIEDTVNGAQTTSWAYSQGVAFAGHAGGEPASAVVVAGSSPRMLLLYPNTSGVLYYRLFDPRFPASGNWLPVPGWPAGVSVRNSTISNANAAGKYSIAFRHASNPNTGASTYVATFDAVGLAWVGGPQLQAGLDSMFTPGLAFAPDGQLFAAVVDVNSRKLAILERSVGAWAFRGDIDSGLSSSPGAGSVNLVFQPLLDQLGNSFADGSGQLVAYWTEAGNTVGDANKDNWNLRRATLGGFISPTARIIAPLVVRQPTGLERPQAGQDIAIARYGNRIGALYIATLWGAAVDVAKGIEWIPNALNALPGFVGDVDTDDANVISGKMCKTLWGQVKGVDAGCYCDTMYPCQFALQYYTPSPMVDEQCPDPAAP